VFTNLSAAPKGKFIELWENRFFICGNMNDGSANYFRLRWSDINDPTTWEANNHIDFRTPTTESSVHVVNNNFANYRYYSGRVTPRNNQIAILNGFYYISDNGLYAMEDDTPVKISEPYQTYFSAANPQSLVAKGDTLYYCRLFIFGNYRWKDI